MDSAKKAVEYMLRRSLALCLSDAKRPIQNSLGVEFSAVNSSDTTSLILFCRPLLVLMNALRMAETFHADVLFPFSSRPSDTQRQSHSRTIDWDKTSTNYVNNIRRVVFSEGPFKGSDEDGRLLSLLQEELRGQCSIVQRVFAQKGAPSHDAIQHSLARWEGINAELESVVGQVDPRRVSRHRAEADLSRAFECFAEYVGRQADGETAAHLYAEYQRNSDPLFASLHAGLRLGRPAFSWRQRYASLSVGLGPGTHLRFLQSRDAAHLFEVWSFLELSYVLGVHYGRSIAQRSFLRGGRYGPTFSLGTDMDAYYNYYGERLDGRTQLASHIMAGSHVEWFIRCKPEYERSVIIDTKFTEWNPADCRTVIGYMTEFGTNFGAVVFRGEIPEGVMRSQEACPHWAVCRFPGSGKVFFVGSLNPTIGAAVQNDATLRKMTSSLGLVDLS